MNKPSNEKSVLAEVNTVLENFELIRGSVGWLQSSKEDLLRLALERKIEEPDFYKLTSLLSTQSRSVLWERYFAQKNGYEPVGRNENRGDLKKNEKYYEYKVSLNDQINFRLLQIRIWQECDYVFQCVTFEKVYTFELTKEEMTKEMELCGVAYAHGTRESNRNNENIEYTMTLRKDSVHWERWMEKYLLLTK